MQMTLIDRPVFFYPHAYLRDRQLDTIRSWPADKVKNPAVATRSRGAQVSRETALSRFRVSWKQKLPLLNLKLRPRDAGDAVVYAWGAVISSGPFIVELDNPYALTGYNLRAMGMYRGLLRRILLSKRCVAIVCISEACRQTLRALFGDDVAARARVRYPLMERKVERIETGEAETRFLFIGTQFEIKGGAALLRAFASVAKNHPSISLDVITHLPAEFQPLVETCPAIRMHAARYSRDEVFERFMRRAHVLIHPTYVDSFGMVVLEALAHGLAVIATDVYALPEMVIDGVNGVLIHPPASIWKNALPTRLYYEWDRLTENIRQVDSTQFEAVLASAILRLSNPATRDSARQASLQLIDTKFSSARRA